MAIGELILKIRNATDAGRETIFDACKIVGNEISSVAVASDPDQLNPAIEWP